MSKMKYWITSFARFVWSYKFTLLSLLFLYLICHSFHSKHNNQFILLVLSFFFLLAGLSKVSKYVKWIATFVLVVAITTDAYFGLILGEHLTFGVLDAILSTNPDEAKGVLSGMLLSIVLLFSGTWLIFILAQKELCKSRVAKSLSFSIFFIYWIVYIPVYSLSRTYFSKNKEEVEMFQKTPAYSLYLKVAKKIPLVYYNVVVYLTYKDQAESLRKYRMMERITPDYVTFDIEAKTPSKIYIVLGESANRANFSLYGYVRAKTTPFLDSLANGEKFFHSYNGLASAPLTTMAVPMALSFATPLDQEPLYRYKNLLELANDAGYETVWLSNQAMLGIADSDISVYSSVATRRHYLDTGTPFDDILLVDKLKEMLNRNKNQLFILHQEGSHLDYRERIDDLDRKAISGVDIIADYDRTIHHTDRFLEQLYFEIEKDGSPYVLIYFSDHGELIGKGHGFITGGDTQFEIPFVTLQNGNFPIEFLVSKYMDRENNRINNAAVINVVSELMGYQISESEVEKVKEASKYVKHVDNNVYLYNDLKTP